MFSDPNMYLYLESNRKWMKSKPDAENMLKFYSSSGLAASIEFITSIRSGLYIPLSSFLANTPEKSRELLIKVDN